MSRYPLKMSKFSSHSVILKCVGDGAGKRLLDVGCADGRISELFLNQGWDVLGIEPDEHDSTLARRRGIVTEQLTLEDASSRLQGKFDTIVLADVLEHCADPWKQLSQLVDLCNPHARIIISLPNIAHIIPRLRLLLGTFRYEDRGIMDRTHLRFFTRKTALELVAHAGLCCDETVVTPTPVELVLPRLTTTRLGHLGLTANAYFARLFPRLLGYQFVLVCSVTSGAR